MKMRRPRLLRGICVMAGGAAGPWADCTIGGAEGMAQWWVK